MNTQSDTLAAAIAAQTALHDAIAVRDAIDNAAGDPDWMKKWQAQNKVCAQLSREKEAAYRAAYAASTKRKPYWY